MNGILDLQCDLRANDFALREEYRLGFERFHLPLSERVALRWILGVSSRILFTLLLSASVSWRWGCVLV